MKTFTRFGTVAIAAFALSTVPALAQDAPLEGTVEGTVQAPLEGGAIDDTLNTTTEGTVDATVNEDGAAVEGSTSLEADTDARPPVEALPRTTEEANESAKAEAEAAVEGAEAEADTSVTLD